MARPGLSYALLSVHAALSITQGTTQFPVRDTPRGEKHAKNYQFSHPVFYCNASRCPRIRAESATAIRSRPDRGPTGPLCRPDCSHIIIDPMYLF